MNWHIYPNGKGWTLRRSKTSRAFGLYRLRRDAIAAGKARIKSENDALLVHNNAGLVVIRIPEIVTEKVAASVFVYDAPSMTKKGRQEIAAWLRNHAKWLLKEGDNYAKRFRGRYLCST